MRLICCFHVGLYVYTKSEISLEINFAYIEFSYTEVRLYRINLEGPFDFDITGVDCNVVGEVEFQFQIESHFRLVQNDRKCLTTYCYTKLLNFFLFLVPPNLINTVKQLNFTD